MESAPIPRDSRRSALPSPVCSASASCLAFVPSVSYRLKLSYSLLIFLHIQMSYHFAVLDVIRYLEANADSMPDYGDRYRTGLRISTGFAESAVNEIIAKRMVKSQQMRWNRHTVQRFLDVRIHVLNGTLEDAFRHWHRGFRPVTASVQAA